MTDDARLAALLGSRICHDLISPIGAIGNGVELMQMSGAASGPEMSLIEESVSSANTRIRFYRIAFGAAGGGQAIARREVVEVLAAMGQSGRLSYDWQPNDDHDRAQVKLVFLMLQCLESSMPYGGTVEVSSEGETWVLTATAQKLRADTDLWSILAGAGATADLTPGTVHFALAARELCAQDRTPSVDITETAIRVRF